MSYNAAPPALGYLLLRRLRWPLVTLLMVYAITILGFTLVPGQDDEGNPWRMDFFHAFYFVSFMGSTIGFGEIPYEFTIAQRAWTIVGIYSTVIAWLYGIGALMATMQDPTFRNLLREQQFIRKVRRLREPFYIVCGYGDTGSMLIHAFSSEGIRAVVIDSRAERIDAILTDNLPIPIPAINANASATHVLKMAGLSNDHCCGVVTITDDNQTNLTIALTTHLLRPKIRVVARAETKEAAANISSFGNNLVINPFETFASRLAMAVNSPAMFLLYERMTGVPHETLRKPITPPKGRWVLCGYGRFGRAVHRRLDYEGLSTVLIESDPLQIDSSEAYIKGLGTEATTLREAGIHEANGIVAGTANDADNLSILLTAKEENPNLFTVARQNDSHNEELFDAAKIDLVMRRGSVIAHKIYAFIRTPLLDTFLNRAQQHDNDWAEQLEARINATAMNRVPDIWEVSVKPKSMPAYFSDLSDHNLTIGDLMRDSRNRNKTSKAVALLLKRGTQETLLPDRFTELESGDELLFCGHESGHSNMNWIIRNANVMTYVITGEEPPSTYLGQWLKKQQDKRTLADHQQ